MNTDTYLHGRGTDMQVPLGEVNPPRHTITQVMHEQGDVLEMVYPLVQHLEVRLDELEWRFNRFAERLIEQGLREAGL